MDSLPRQRAIPARAIAISLLALAAPVGGQLVAPTVAEYELLLWLLALVPAFLFAYYRGWRGAATALSSGMVVLAVAQPVLTYTGRGIENWPLFFLVLVLYLAIALAVGWMSEMLHQARESAERLALVDELTGLANRRLLGRALDTEFGAAQRGRPLVVAIFDLDRFKRYNDTQGHVAGDEALRLFGRLLATHTRRMDLSARLGGEEFVTVLSEAQIPGALVFVERVRSALSAAPVAGGPLTASAGLAAFHPGMQAPDELLAAADRALYAAKAAGGDRVHVALVPATPFVQLPDLSSAAPGGEPAGRPLDPNEAPGRG